MTSALKQAIFRLSKRAESSAREKLSQTFVDIEPIFSLLSSSDHQILYGRRGTGKTHVLNYLASSREEVGDAVIITDLRNIGSSSGLYADQTIELSERATRLLVDTLASIHSGLFDYFIENSEELDLSQTGPALDLFADSITEVRVVGSTETNTLELSSTERTRSHSTSLSLSQESGISITDNSNSILRNESKGSINKSGKEQLYINFGQAGFAIRKIIECLNGRKLWVLLDEWSSIPLELQPYLADLIRRTLLPAHGVIVKIAAIEHRSNFMISRENGNYIGIESGADASADVNLDDFMVFDNDSNKSQEFFQKLISQHISASIKEIKTDEKIPESPEKIVNEIFTEKRSFEEFVRACEGVPRDGINILSIAAQKSQDNKISVNHIRTAAELWYQRDKEKAANANELSAKLLNWIIDTVIGKRKTRAFLFRSDENSEKIDSLYDSRVLHILKRSISSNDQPGIRYNVYKLDYGCYVNLLNTTKAPQGLLPFEDDPEMFTDVPPDDYRSIRRAILDLDRFNQANQTK